MLKADIKKEKKKEEHNLNISSSIRNVLMDVNKYFLIDMIE